MCVCFFFSPAFSTHSKHKRTQLRAAQNRYRKQKSLLGHLKSATPSSNISSPLVEEPPSNEMSMDSQTATTATTEIVSNNDLSQTTSNLLPGSDRQTRGFRVHIEKKTHTITRTNRKQKSSMNIKQEPVENNPKTSESSASTPTKESKKRSRMPRQKRSLSPSIGTPPPITPVTLNILSSEKHPPSPGNKNPKKRRHIPIPPSSNDFKSSPSDYPIVKVEPAPTSPPLIRPSQYHPIPPPIDPRNPVTWNVNDVCWYLNESGCSFALKVIKEQVKKKPTHFSLFCI